MSRLINGLIKWREEKMERAGAGLSSQWQRRTRERMEGQMGGGWEGDNRRAKCGSQIPLCALTKLTGTIQ